MDQMANMAERLSTKVVGTGSTPASRRRHAKCRCPQALVNKQIRELKSWHSGFPTGQNIVLNGGSFAGLLINVMRMSVHCRVGPGNFAPSRSQIRT